MRGSPRVFMWHGFEERDDAGDPYRVFVGPDSFARQLDALAARGAHFLDLDGYLAGLGTGRWPARSVLVTIDDGYVSTLTCAAPLLAARGVPAVLFALAGRVGGRSAWMPETPDEPLLDGDGLRELERHGVRVEAHGWDHTLLPGLPAAELRRQVADTRDALGGLLGRAPVAFAYPSGRHDAAARAAVRDAGYACAFAVHDAPDRRWAGRRVDVNPTDTDRSFALKAGPWWPLAYGTVGRVAPLRRSVHRARRLGRAAASRLPPEPTGQALHPRRAADEVAAGPLGAGGEVLRGPQPRRRPRGQVGGRHHAGGVLQLVRLLAAHPVQGVVVGIAHHPADGLRVGDPSGADVRPPRREPVVPAAQGPAVPEAADVRRQVAVEVQGEQVDLAGVRVPDEHLPVERGRGRHVVVGAPPEGEVALAVHALELGEQGADPLRVGGPGQHRLEAAGGESVADLAECLLRVAADVRVGVAAGDLDDRHALAGDQAGVRQDAAERGDHRVGVRHLLQPQPPARRPPQPGGDRRGEGLCGLGGARRQPGVVGRAVAEQHHVEQAPAQTAGQRGGSGEGARGVLDEHQPGLPPGRGVGPGLQPGAPRGDRQGQVAGQQVEGLGLVEQRLSPVRVPYVRDHGRILSRGRCGPSGGCPVDVRAAQQAVARAAARLDGLLGERLVVAGSLPPEARDLDLLVPAQARPGVERALRAAGFGPAPEGWRDGEAVVELLDDLPAAVHEAVRGQARPLPGLARLRRPAPHHALLLLAVQRAAGGRLDLRRRARAARALAEDPGAWDRAAAQAPAWGATASLAWLRQAYEGDGTAGRPVRARAAAERLRAEGRRWPRLRALRGVVRPTRLPLPVVALSGLDGSGKSTQARLLVAALQDAGLDAVVLWDRISYSDALLRLTTPLRLALRLAPGATERLATGVVLPRNDDPDGPYAVPDLHRALRGLRERVPAVTPLWVGLVVALHAVPLRRTTLHEARQGRVVVRDRYLLDSLVHLQARYGREGLRPQQALLRRAAPEPLAAFLLDVPPEVAYARKPEEHPLSALEQHRDLYLEHAAALGVPVVPADRPPAELSAELAAQVLRLLGVPVDSAAQAAAGAHGGGGGAGRPAP